jgi:hypothetical protein
MMQSDSGMGDAVGSVVRSMERITEGMTVVDLAGETVGKVEYVQFGDPQAVTTEGNDLERPGGGVIGEAAMAVFGDEREPDVDEPLRTQLLRYGFIKVDGPGLFSKDRYVRADLIGNVSDDVVTLKVGKADLPRED